MRLTHRTSHSDATTSSQDLILPRGRHPVPTQTSLRTRRVPAVMYVLALLIIPSMVVFGFMSAGFWATTGTSITAQSDTPSKEGGTGTGTGTAAPADPADVKGSMTVQQVVDAFPTITAAEVLTQFSAPLDTPTSTQLKDLVESSGGTDIPAVRVWLAVRAAG